MTSYLNNTEPYVNKMDLLISYPLILFWGVDFQSSGLKIEFKGGDKYLQSNPVKKS